MNTKRLFLTTVFFCTQLVISWVNPAVEDLNAYMSPGNFYEQGELAVVVTNIPDTTAPVELDVYTPSVADTYPVVIFIHGFSGSITGYENISTQLASHGFVVILPQMYVGTAPTPEDEALLGVQIVSWVETNINNHIFVTADTNLLGLAGHSRGGQTAYRMTLQVPQKVDALAGVDPVDGLEIFGQSLVITGPLTFDIPTYILGTGLGPIIVDEFLACAPEEIGPIHFYCANPDPTWLATATTHGHADMIDEEDFSEFCPGGSDRDGMRAFTGGTLAAFFSGILQGNVSALLVLSDPVAAPVPAEMEMNRMGDACDADQDGVPDGFDNCYNTPNQEQTDSYPPNKNDCGDACECEGNFDDDDNQDGSDAAIFKADFGRNSYNEPCSTPAPCDGNFDCDDNVDGSDAAIFKTDFGRNQYNSPCPSCPTEPWCTTYQ